MAEALPMDAQENAERYLRSEAQKYYWAVRLLHKTFLMFLHGLSLLRHGNVAILNDVDRLPSKVHMHR